MESINFNYVIFFILFIIGQSLVMIGSFISLPYKNLTLWQSIKMALPFVWLDWIFLTYAISLMHTHSLLTNTQFLFLIIVFQFGAALLINKFYLKQIINISDYFAIVLLVFAYIISEFHLFSKFFNLPITEEKKSNEKIQTEVNKNNIRK